MADGADDGPRGAVLVGIAVAEAPLGGSARSQPTAHSRTARAFSRDLMIGHRTVHAAYNAAVLALGV